MIMDYYQGNLYWKVRMESAIPNAITFPMKIVDAVVE